jgi:hypothetical protein
MVPLSLVLKDRVSGREWRVALPENKGIILSVYYTNKNFADSLKKAGVPLIEDTSPEETQQKQLVKKARISFRYGGSGVRPILAEGGNSIIEGVGKKIYLPEGLSVNGRELLVLLLQLAEKRGIKTFFIRSRRRATEAGLGRVTPKTRQKFITKLYFFREVWFPDGKGVKAVLPQEAVKLLADFLDSSWYLHIFNNPETIVFELTYKQPGKTPTHAVFLA